LGTRGEHFNQQPVKMPGLGARTTALQALRGADLSGGFPYR
jgi:hypothetical protein